MVVKNLLKLIEPANSIVALSMIHNAIHQPEFNNLDNRNKDTILKALKEKALGILNIKTLKKHRSYNRMRLR